METFTYAELDLLVEIVDEYRENLEPQMSQVEWAQLKSLQDKLDTLLDKVDDVL